MVGAEVLTWHFVSPREVMEGSVQRCRVQKVPLRIRGRHPPPKHNSHGHVTVSR
jgi:hypothetical protein